MSHVVTQVSGMQARSDVCSEMRLVMMPPVLTNGLSSVSDSGQWRGQWWKEPMRSLAASLPRELHAASTLNLWGWGRRPSPGMVGLFSYMPALSVLFVCRCRCVAYLQSIL